jgi:hypothetical protein
VGELAKVGFGRREESGYFGRTLRMSPTGGPHLSAVEGKSEVRECARGLASPTRLVGPLAWPSWTVIFFLLSSFFFSFICEAFGTKIVHKNANKI